MNISQILEEANKLIFVKKYEEAYRVLDELVKREEGKEHLLSHLRRIELSSRLGKIQEVHDEFVKTKDTLTRSVCLAFAEQFGQMVPLGDSIQRFRSIMDDYGETASCYFGMGFGFEMQGSYERAIYNYQESVQKDQGWYPSYFGLSQIYYLQNNEKLGDHYFYLFEKYAPFNLYGNFETHRQLKDEFLSRGKFEEAEVAIISLGDWWFENKGECPIEIQIYESLCIAQIASMRGQSDRSVELQRRAYGLSDKAYEAEQISEDSLNFIAKVWEEFNDYSKALIFYQKLLQSPNASPALIQKIGGQFVSAGEYNFAIDLFREAYHRFPQNQELKLCLLISKMKAKGINCEEYLQEKERLENFLRSDQERVAVFSLLHRLLAMFSEDSDIHGYMGEMCLKLDNKEKAEYHFAQMYQLDGDNIYSLIKYVTFLLTSGNLEKVEQLLQPYANKLDLPSELSHEIDWLFSTLYWRKGDFKSSLEFVKKILKKDSWNPSYLIRQIVCLTAIAIPEEKEGAESHLNKLQLGDESNLNWYEFDVKSHSLGQKHLYELAYYRKKLFFLYNHMDPKALKGLVDAACEFDIQAGMIDLLKLVNTNFDTPWLYLALSFLGKELWQFETSLFWLDYIRKEMQLSAPLKGKVYLELGDTYLWLEKDLPRAIEYLHLALELEPTLRMDAYLVLAHTHLKLGQIRHAQTYLDEIENSGKNFEVTYLKGLLAYRNGNKDKAKTLWKPLLRVQSKSLRYHHMKNELMRYYYEGEDYLRLPA